MVAVVVVAMLRRMVVLRGVNVLGCGRGLRESCPCFAKVIFES